MDSTMSGFAARDAAEMAETAEAVRDRTMRRAMAASA